MTVTDITVIGGGPAGLYAAFYSGVRQMSVRLIEAQEELGGKVRLYPEKMIWDVGGVPPARGSEFRKNLIQQGLTFDPEVHTGTTVTDIKRQENGQFEIITHDGRSFASKTVIIAAGSGIINPQRLTIDGAERFEISNLHYTVQSLETFRGKNVLISGGGNAAIDWANELDDIAGRVILSCRSEVMKGHESEVNKVMCSNVDCQFRTSIHRLIASEDGSRIAQVELLCGEDEYRTVDVDHVIVNHGYERELTFLNDSTIALEQTGHQRIAADADGRTSIDGLYAAGDVVDYSGKLNLLAGAFQDAANAVNAAKQFVDPEAGAKGMVSSHNEVFKKRNEEMKKQEAASK
ncbi:NAD(P)/FAD-dependent oxidoreductase [Alkalicoccus urumqiensis]|uniref:Ferredoxin--NADP reductase n=1 Tax=Alkalicoccus urumqiensis TaxID=1548213 RepID=A0A2P6MII1_ALKUR|nr:NAD(P)/FAD-dependent oxidoreductase [Alkalicoccus urumqiensis]PRO66071.1 thioredoxin reductase [Alkalicoccus urumqiensis]